MALNIIKFKIYVLKPRYKYSFPKFSTTEDEQSGNPINFANDFIKLDSHLAIKAKFILRIDFNVELLRIIACNLQTIFKRQFIYRIIYNMV